MCKCEPVITLNQDCLKLNKTLKILFFIYIIFIIGKIFLRDYNGAFSDFLNILLLILCFLLCHYLIAGYLIFMVLFTTFYALVFLGQRVQNKVTGQLDIFLIKGIFAPVIVLQTLSFIFYIILIYYLFQAFKEYKAVYFNGGGYSNNNDII